MKIKRELRFFGLGVDFSGVVDLGGVKIPDMDAGPENKMWAHIVTKAVAGPCWCLIYV